MEPPTGWEIERCGEILHKRAGTCYTDRKATLRRKSAEVCTDSLTPMPIDVESLGFDDAHVNQKRCHHVSELEAKQYIQDAAVSVTVWGGKFERYFSERGAAYVEHSQKYPNCLFCRRVR